MATATFGAGCFWGVEAAFRNVDGVTATAVGYEGGHADNPSYEEVCVTRTGHAEVVEVEFDPQKVSTRSCSTSSGTNHDPTQLNRQGPDVGDQYRSVIFFHDEDQEKAAGRRSRPSERSGRHRRPIVTQIVPADDVLEGRGLPPAVPGEARPGHLPHPRARSVDQRQARPGPVAHEQAARAREGDPGRAALGAAEADVGDDRVEQLAVGGEVLDLAVGRDDRDAAVDEGGHAHVAALLHRQRVEQLQPGEPGHQLALVGAAGQLPGPASSHAHSRPVWVSAT